jgi:steroid 5-alpha reductase family enzyme
VTRRTATAIVVAAALSSVALMAVAWTLAYLNGDLNVVTSQFGPDLVVPITSVEPVPTTATSLSRERQRVATDISMMPRTI